MRQAASPYQLFGNQTWETSGATVDCLFGYTGRMFDEGSQLQYNSNRWYDPATGRWMSEDPIGAGSNPYGYVGNDPMTFTDSSGLRALGGLTTRPTQELYQSDIDPNTPFVDPLGFGGGFSLPSLGAVASGRFVARPSASQLVDDILGILRSTGAGLPGPLVQEDA